MGLRVFEAPKGYHMSDDGLVPWAYFQPELTADGQNRVFRFSTADQMVIERVLANVPGVVEVTPAAPQEQPAPEQPVEQPEPEQQGAAGKGSR